MKQINGWMMKTAAPHTVGWIAVGEIGFIQGSRIVGLGSANTAPMRRLLQAVSPESVVILTGGRRRETAVFLDSGHVFITALSLSEWQTLLRED